MENILEINNLSKKYDKFSLNDVNFNVPKGMIVGLVGENGAGKTTTIKSILNIINIDSGTIKVFGKDNKKDEKEIKKELGVVLDDSFLSDYLTAKDVNTIFKSVYDNWDEILFNELLEKFSLPNDKMSKEFSSGMKMKLKIASALAHHPKFLILDEPTSGLDPIARSEVLDIFSDFIQNEDCSILFSTHITTDLEHIADYIVFINDGKIILDKPKDELLDNYGIVKCSEEELKKFDKKDYIKYKKSKYQVDVLVSNKNEFKKKYDVEVIDKANIEEIMVLIVKGEK